MKNSIAIMGALVGLLLSAGTAVAQDDPRMRNTVCGLMGLAHPSLGTVCRVAPNRPFRAARPSGEVAPQAAPNLNSICRTFIGDIPVPSAPVNSVCMVPVAGRGLYQGFIVW